MITLGSALTTGNSVVISFNCLSGESGMVLLRHDEVKTNKLNPIHPL